MTMKEVCSILLKAVLTPLITLAEDEYIDYDSDAELGVVKMADVDPYAGCYHHNYVCYLQYTNTATRNILF